MASKLVFAAAFMVLVYLAVAAVLPDSEKADDKVATIPRDLFDILHKLKGKPITK